MPRKAVLLAAASVGCGILAFVLYSLEGARMDVRKLGVEVLGRVTRNWWTRDKPSSRPKHWIDYEYAVDGVPFKGTERRVRGPLAEGGPIQVWIDPRRPDRCVSGPELRFGRDLEWAFVAACFAFVALVGAVWECLRRPPPALKA